VLGKYLDLRGKKSAGGWRRPQNEGLHNF